MKRTLLAVMVLTAVAVGQELQLHYDFSSDRDYVTTTLTMFRPDKLGSTFFFVDFNYADGIERNSASLGYWEITRMFSVPKVRGLKAGIQYNDGLNTAKGLGNVWLAGAEYPVDLKFITLGTSLWLRSAENQDPGVQVTILWSKRFLNDKLTLCGFVDLWQQHNADFDAQGTNAQWVILSEPQLWYNVLDKIAVGGEVEISRNFVFGADDDLKVYPTVAVKWIF